jgi:hypothetical protein
VTNFRSLTPGGFYGNGESPGPDGTKHSVAERANNPGAINGAAWEREFPGFVSNIKYDGKNDTTVFETPEHGVAAYLELLRRYRAGGTKTVEGIIWKYGGGQGNYHEYARTVSDWTNIPVGAEIDLSDDAQLIKFAKAMWRMEAGHPTRLSDAQIALGFKMARGRIAAGQGQPLPPPPKRTSSEGFAAQIVRAMEALNYKVDRGPGELNVVYAEGTDVDGAPNTNRPNAFDDCRLLIGFESGRPTIVGAWEATTEPGKYWTENRMNADGAFHIALGQQQCWRRGTYHDMPALVEVEPVRGTRDDNEDYSRTGDAAAEGNFGVHHHGGYDYPRDDMGRSSAGCLVGRSVQGHARFMALIDGDPRQKADPARLWRATVLSAAQVAAHRPSPVSGGALIAGTAATGAVVAATHGVWDKIEVWHVVGATGLLVLAIVVATTIVRYLRR